MEKRLLIRFCAAVALTALCLSTSHATMMLNEVFVNPPGTDNGLEFVELRSSTGGVEAMTGLTLLVIEGEGAAAGTVDQALSLNAFSTGTNGLFLWRDAATVMVPAPDAATSINVADFSPDIENGTQTYALVSGFSGAVATDYDGDNDGVLDSTPWTSVVDAVGYIDNGGGAEFSYGAGLGGVSFPIAPAGFDTESVLRLRDGQWILADVSGVNGPGPFSFDPTETMAPSGALVDSTRFDIQTLTPGSRNPVVPEPTTLALAGLGLLVGAASRRCRVAR